MWIEHDTGKPTLQWENSETKEIIQSYGKDSRYPAFKDKLDSGEIVPIKFEDTAEYRNAGTDTARQEKIAEIEQIEKSALRALLTLSKGENAPERKILNDKIAQIEALRAEL